MPANNYYTSGIPGVGFISPSGFTGDWSLGSSSAFRSKASDGTDPGLNFTFVRNATTTALSP